MNLSTAVERLNAMSLRGKDVFTSSDLRAIFPGEKPKTFSEGLRRLAAAGVVERVQNGIYHYSHSALPRAEILERIAIAARRFDHCYISLESAMSQHGLISQIPVGRLTVMTTGRGGEIDTPWGTIEFTHSARDPAEVLDSCVSSGGSQLPMATAEAALRDLRRVGRNLHMIDPEELAELEASGAAR